MRQRHIDREKFHELRVKTGHSKDFIVQKLGISGDLYQKWLSKKRAPDAAHLDMLGRLLSVGHARLLEGAEPALVGVVSTFAALVEAALWSDAPRQVRALVLGALGEGERAGDGDDRAALRQLLRDEIAFYNPRFAETWWPSDATNVVEFGPFPTKPGFEQYFATRVTLHEESRGSHTIDVSFPLRDPWRWLDAKTRLGRRLSRRSFRVDYATLHLFDFGSTAGGRVVAEHHFGIDAPSPWLEGELDGRSFDLWVWADPRGFCQMLRSKTLRIEVEPARPTGVESLHSEAKSPHVLCLPRAPYQRREGANIRALRSGGTLRDR